MVRSCFVFIVCFVCFSFVVLCTVAHMQIGQVFGKPAHRCPHSADPPALAATRRPLWGTSHLALHWRITPAHGQDCMDVSYVQSLYSFEPVSVCQAHYNTLCFAENSLLLERNVCAHPVSHAVSRARPSETLIYHADEAARLARMPPWVPNVCFA